MNLQDCLSRWADYDEKHLPLTAWPSEKVRQDNINTIAWLRGPAINTAKQINANTWALDNPPTEEIWLVQVGYRVNIVDQSQYDVWLAFGDNFGGVGGLIKPNLEFEEAADPEDPNDIRHLLEKQAVEIFQGPNKIN
jgi:hypothetical protein